MFLFKSPKFIFALVALIVFILGVFIYLNLFVANQKTASLENFVAPLNSENSDIISNLKTSGFIKNQFVFNLARVLKSGGDITPGGYKISKSMTPWQIAGVLTKAPYLKWVVIPEGRRKEQIADILAEALRWNDEIKTKWIKEDTAQKSDYLEGVYFPDTYLIPIDETHLEVANRLIGRFNEKFSPYLQEAVKQNIKWTTLIKIASLIERETGGPEDMPLISGIIWNRLLKKMKLDIDATLQYARDSALWEAQTQVEWWASLKTEDKKIDSKYNTYLYAGLPPHPIANPGLDAIAAALNPEKTDCFYYLHDSSKQIHCAKTYTEHKQNIDRYLK